MNQGKKKGRGATTVSPPTGLENLNKFKGLEFLCFRLSFPVFIADGSVFLCCNLIVKDLVFWAV